jgi:signal transduction histidine kinase/DNA-binding response OmpR family regulator
MDMPVEAWQVLLVEDDEDDFILTRSMLKSAHYRKIELDWARTYDQGLEMLQGHPYDAVLVDYDLGARNGIELIRQAVALGCSAPLILFTGRGGYEVDVEAMQAGAILYLSKEDVRSLLLERAIRYAIEWRQIENELARRNQELQAVQARLADEKRLLEAVLQTLPVGLSITDHHGGILQTNAAFHQVWGGPPPQTHSISDYVSYQAWWADTGKPVAPEEWASAQAVLKGETVVGQELVIQRFDGLRAVVLNSAAPTLDASGRVTGSVVAIQDISHHVQTEEKLKWISLLPAENPQPVLRVALDGTLLYANPASAGLLETWRCTEGKALPEDWRQAVCAAVEAHAPREWEVEYEGRLYSFLIQPVANEGYANLYGREITQQRLLMQQVQDYARRLEQANRELEEFAFVASHDLQEPLRKIRSFSAQLLRQHHAALPAEAVDKMKRMDSAAGRMQRMIDALLDLSRVSAKGRPFQPVELGQVAAQAIADLEVRIHQERGQVILAELPVVDADPQQMYQLFLNLIGNSLKFHKPGEPPRVLISARSLPAGEAASPGMLEIRFADQGIGFDPKNAQKIFQPFQRLHSRAEYDGSGMGLSICRKIVERHGGSITAEGHPGEGAVFIVRLPKGKT